MKEQLEKKIVKFNGGLGNQMFQYAFAYAVSKIFDVKVVFDYSYFDDVKKCDNVATREYELCNFNLNCEAVKSEDLEKIKYPKASLQKRFPKLFGVNYKREKKLWQYDKNMLKPYIYCYEGYFQNEKYFKNYRKDLIEKFSLSEPLDEKNLNILNEIKKTNSVSLHVRRGDYVTLDYVRELHGSCTLDYYKNAIEYLKEKIETPHFFLFSDDIGWVLENLKLDYPYTVVDINQNRGYLDLELMKHCKNNIIANSSFSWWGAWLNQNSEKIVIAPKKWTNKKYKCDIVPKEWVKL